MRRCALFSADHCPRRGEFRGCGSSCSPPFLILAKLDTSQERANEAFRFTLVEGEGMRFHKGNQTQSFCPRPRPSDEVPSALLDKETRTASDPATRAWNLLRATYKAMALPGGCPRTPSSFEPCFLGLLFPNLNKLRLNYPSRNFQQRGDGVGSFAVALGRCRKRIFNRTSINEGRRHSSSARCRVLQVPQACPGSARNPQDFVSLRNRLGAAGSCRAHQHQIGCSTSQVLIPSRCLFLNGKYPH